MTILLCALGVLIALFLLSLTPPGVGYRRRLMARIYPAVQAKYEAAMAERKRVLLEAVSGTVLEIGPGTGANFAYFDDRVERWIGIEPNPHMHRELRAAATEHGVVAEFRTVTIEGMAVDDASVDVVLSTLVLCSVPDPAGVLREVRRVLKPGGRFVFVEHVGADRGSRLRLVQRILRPSWRYLADGCHLDRDLGEVIRDAGFHQLDCESFRAPKGIPAIVSPHVAGIAVN